MSLQDKVFSLHVLFYSWQEIMNRTLCEFIQLCIHKPQWCFVCWYCLCRVTKFCDLFIFPIDAHLLNDSSCLTIHKGSKWESLFPITKWRCHSPWSQSSGLGSFGKEMTSTQNCLLSSREWENLSSGLCMKCLKMDIFLPAHALALLRDPITLQNSVDLACCGASPTGTTGSPSSLQMAAPIPRAC